jgi:membrane protease YdiL (CAAX protease family)
MDGSLWPDNPAPAATFPAGWYADPWHVAPWRYFDGAAWTAILYGDYGEAWPLTLSGSAPFVAKGPGIKGGGIASIGAGVGVVGSVVVAIVFIIVSRNRALNASNPWYFAISEFALWTGFFGAAVVASKLNGSGNLVADYGLSWPRWKDLGIGCAAGVLGRLWPLLILVLYVLSTANGFDVSNSTAPKILGITPIGVGGWTVLILITVVGAPIVEEIFFRGLVQGAFTRRVGAMPAIFLTALVFALVHVSDEGILAPIILLPMALILGYLKQRTGRLAPGMIAHAVFNATVLLLFLVPAFR